MSPGGELFGRLPDELLSHVLSFLPSRKAVQASCLSRRWRLRPLRQQPPHRPRDRIRAAAALLRDRRRPEDPPPLHFLREKVLPVRALLRLRRGPLGGQPPRRRVGRTGHVVVPHPLAHGPLRPAGGRAVEAAVPRPIRLAAPDEDSPRHCLPRRRPAQLLLLPGAVAPHPSRLCPLRRHTGVALGGAPRHRRLQHRYPQTPGRRAR